jgi:hypothetical protein
MYLTDASRFFLLLLLLFNRLPPDITGGQGLKNIFMVFFTINKIYTITTQ